MESFMPCALTRRHHVPAPLGRHVGLPELLPVEARGDVDVELLARFGVAQVVVARQVASSRTAQLARPRGDDVEDRRAELAADAAAVLEVIEVALAHRRVRAGEPLD